MRVSDSKINDRNSRGSGEFFGEPASEGFFPSFRSLPPEPEVFIISFLSTLPEPPATGCFLVASTIILLPRFILKLVKSSVSSGTFGIMMKS